MKDFLDGPLRVTFVLGTDTGVGKTRLMASLAAASGNLGGIMLVKAVQTGAKGTHGSGERDVETYSARISLPEDRIWEGYSFALPIDPMTAAASEGKSIDPYVLSDKIRSFYLQGLEVLVEGSGGVLSPFFPDGSGILTLIKVLDLPFRVFLVSHPHLGCLSQILSAVRILEADGITPSALFLCPRPGVVDEATHYNPDTCRRLLPGVPVIHLD